jgi:AGCS family alanine or glycine:cation symporter
VQGIVQSFSVFIDTILICSCTAFVILLSGIDISASGGDGVVLTQNALAEHIGPWAKSFVAVALSLFVLSSIMYNYYLGENAVEFFSGAQRSVFNVFRVLTFGIIIAGSMSDLSTVFAFSNLTMGLLAVVNLFALALLFPIGLRILRDFGRQLKGGNKPIFDSQTFADLDIDHDAWELLPEDRAR